VRTDEEARAAFDRTPGWRPNGARSRTRGASPLAFVRMADAKVSGMPKDVVEGLAGPELTVGFGSPGSAKTYFFLVLGMAVATGQPFFGRKVRGGPVVYVAAEKAKSVEARLAYMRDQAGGQSGPLFIVQDRVDVADKDNSARLRAVLDLAEAEAGEPVRLVIVDTVRRVLGPLKEDEEGFGVLIDWCGRLAREIGTAVLLIHHCGKDQSRGARGHSSLLGAVEREVFIAKGERRAEPRIVHVTKANDGEEGPVMAFDLVPGHAGEDADGEPLTLCSVEAVDLQTALTGTQPGAASDQVRLSGRQRAALRIVRKLDRDGTGAPYDAVRSHLIQEIAGEAKPPAEPDKMADRTLKWLIEREIIEHEHGRLSVIE
jgi:hypothetical protein